MNKKEISEIKKLFTKEHCRIDHISCCYVNGQKEKLLTTTDAFFSLPEEEAYKYFDIFRKTLSGSIGKNLMTMEFPLEEEEEDGRQAFLMDLVSSSLGDEDLLNQYFDRVIETFSYAENFLIVLIDGSYDIPAKGTDGLEQFDASEYVYHYILSSICPVSLAKPALAYNPEQNRIEDRVRDWVVSAPEIGFLFPAFHDRNTDIHQLLFYSKNAALPNAETAETLLGCVPPLPAKDQHESFNSMVEEALGEECSFDAVRSINENLTEMLEENKENPEPVSLSKKDVSRLLSSCGAPEENLPVAEAHFTEAIGEKNSLMASNITALRSFEVKTPDVTVQVKPDRSDLVETRLIDGKPYLVIALTDEVSVNGIRITPPKAAEEE